MPFRLRISNEEVKSELVKMGYSDLSDEIIDEFRKDLLKLIKEDLKNIKRLKKFQECQLEDGYIKENYNSDGKEPSSTSTAYSEYKKEKSTSSSSSSGYSETFDRSYDSYQSLTSNNLKLKWDRRGTEASSSQSGESASQILTSDSSRAKDSMVSVSTHKAEKIVPPVKLRESKDKDLPTYPDKPDAVNLYHYYKAHWDKYKVPGEDPRSALRWEVRSQLFYSS